ncbi:uncharacterized protein [Oncorhynchus clarkii lewisi]|uniref:uncharacterized protein n=1 Tax=Oncorhynchus clarkii lewisi TaxID=490388 RepID=UPI0039B8371A
MCWIRVAVICVLISLVKAQKECFKRVVWSDLLHSLNILCKDISHECVHHHDKASLCDPQLMLGQIEHKEVVLADIMKKAVTMYEKSPQFDSFSEQLAMSQHRLTSCVMAQLPSNADHEPVTACFNKLENFLHHKKAHLQCAWKIIHITVREILQRFEKRTVRGLRRRR